MKMLISILIFVLLPTAAWADFYKWKDDAGKTHYADSPGKVPFKYRKDTHHQQTANPKVIKRGSPDDKAKIIDGLISENNKNLKKAKKGLRKYREQRAEIEAEAESRLKVGAHSNLRIDEYCNEKYDTNLGYAWTCRNRLEAAENDLSSQSIRASHELKYCKRLWGLPRWIKIKDCYHRQIKYREKYKRKSSRTGSAVKSRCDDLYEDGDWSGKIYCISNLR